MATKGKGSARIAALMDTIRIMLRSWTGKIGFVLLLVFLILGLYVMVEYYPETTKSYMKGYLWLYKYPEAVPPCWVVKEKSEAVTVTYDSLNKTGLHQAMLKLKSFGKTRFIKGYRDAYWYAFNYTENAPPNEVDMVLTVNVGQKTRLSRLIVFIKRPDDRIVTLYNGTLKKGNHTLLGNFEPTLNMTLPIGLSRLSESHPVYRFLVKSLEQIYASKKVIKISKIGKLIFLEGGNKTLSEMKVVKGVYNVSVILEYTLRSGANINDTDARMILDEFFFKTKSNCYGYFGTDQWGRPIGLGLLLGIPYAFLIGFIVTFTSTFIGAIYGVAAGYWKGIRSEFMMRIADVVNSLPFLPILIALAFVFKARITLLLLSFLMIILWWASPVIVVRSMALQISEQLYVEAAKATGAGTRRIIFRYIFPQVMPYAVAIAVLSIPGVIVTEAGLSLLGLGDPTAPTWGKMLQNAYDVQAVVQGWWWLYIFPGLALAIFSATFLLVGRAIEPIVSPKLQR